MAVHLAEEGDVLCSHGKESERSNTILDVTCRHCWNKYDKREDRLPNIREVEESARQIKQELESAKRSYEARESREIITEFAYWFLEGPDSVPEDLTPNEDILGIEKSKIEKAKGGSRAVFMTRRSREALPVGMWSKRYRKRVDRLLRAMHPVLIDPEEAQKSRFGADLKKEVFDREGDECPMCGVDFSESERTIDHIIPSLVGGPTEEWNLRVLCNSCNSFKHVMVDPDGVYTVAERLEERLRE